MMLRLVTTLIFAVVAHAEPQWAEELLAKQAQLEAQIATLQQQQQQQFLQPKSEPMPRAGKHVARQLSTADLQNCLSYLWLLVCGALVMFMQAGFAILECGSCRQKNAGTILMKNLMDACLGTICWYLLGYGIAYGGEAPFIGDSKFGNSGFADAGSNDYRDWFFQWAFCATTATIVSGAVAERIHFASYVIYAVIMTVVIYPVIVHWTWCSGGWLYSRGYSDFAGSGIVHLTGGISALVGAIILGPRTGRFDSKDSTEFDPHNMGMVVLGTFILWFGWYGFNCGSTLGFADSATATLAALVAMNTTVSAATGGLTIWSVRLALTRKLDVGGTCNGILAGLVAVCAGVGAVAPWGALIIGMLGGLAHEVASMSLKKLKVDDPLDAFAVHGAAGIVGVLMRPLLDWTDGVNGEMFGIHCLAIVMIILWSGGISAITFGIMRVLKMLRVDVEEELQGADAKVLAQAYHSPPKDNTTVVT